MPTPPFDKIKAAIIAVTSSPGATDLPAGYTYTLHYRVTPNDPGATPKLIHIIVHPPAAAQSQANTQPPQSFYLDLEKVDASGNPAAHSLPASFATTLVKRENLNSDGLEMFTTPQKLFEHYYARIIAAVPQPVSSSAAGSASSASGSSSSASGSPSSAAAAAPPDMETFNLNLFIQAFDEHNQTLKAKETSVPAAGSTNSSFISTERKQLKKKFIEALAAHTKQIQEQTDPNDAGEVEALFLRLKAIATGLNTVDGSVKTKATALGNVLATADEFFTRLDTEAPLNTLTTDETIAARKAIHVQYEALVKALPEATSEQTATKQAHMISLASKKTALTNFVEGKNSDLDVLIGQQWPDVNLENCHYDMVSDGKGNATIWVKEGGVAAAPSAGGAAAAAPRELLIAKAANGVYQVIVPGQDTPDITLPNPDSEINDRNTLQANHAGINNSIQKGLFKPDEDRADLLTFQNLSRKDFLERLYINDRLQAFNNQLTTPGDLWALNGTGKTMREAFCVQLKTLQQDIAAASENDTLLIGLQVELEKLITTFTEQLRDAEIPFAEKAALINQHLPANYNEEYIAYAEKGGKSGYIVKAAYKSVHARSSANTLPLGGHRARGNHDHANNAIFHHKVEGTVDQIDSAMPASWQDDAGNHYMWNAGNRHALLVYQPQYAGKTSKWQYAQLPGQWANKDQPAPLERRGGFPVTLNVSDTGITAANQASFARQNLSALTHPVGIHSILDMLHIEGHADYEIFESGDGQGLPNYLVIKDKTAGAHQAQWIFARNKDNLYVRREDLTFNSARKTLTNPANAASANLTKWAPTDRGIGVPVPAAAGRPAAAGAAVAGPGAAVAAGAGPGAAVAAGGGAEVAGPGAAPQENDLVGYSEALARRALPIANLEKKVKQALINAKNNLMWNAGLITAHLAHYAAGANITILSTRESAFIQPTIKFLTQLKEATAEEKKTLQQKLDELRAQQALLGHRANEVTQTAPLQKLIDDLENKIRECEVEEQNYAKQINALENIPANKTGYKSALPTEQNKGKGKSAVAYEGKTVANPNKTADTQQRIYQGDDRKTGNTTVTLTLTKPKDPENEKPQLVRSELASIRDHSRTGIICRGGVLRNKKNAYTINPQVIVDHARDAAQNLSGGIFMGDLGTKDFDLGSLCARANNAALFIHNPKLFNQKISLDLLKTMVNGDFRLSSGVHLGVFEDLLKLDPKIKNTLKQMLKHKFYSPKNRKAHDFIDGKSADLPCIKETITLGQLMDLTSRHIMEYGHIDANKTHMTVQGDVYGTKRRGGALFSAGGGSGAAGGPADAPGAGGDAAAAAAGGNRDNEDTPRSSSSTSRSSITASSDDKTGEGASAAASTSGPSGP